MVRAEARGLFISASGFTPAAADSVRTFLTHRPCVLCELEEIINVLKNGESVQRSPGPQGSGRYPAETAFPPYGCNPPLIQSYS
jgi:hypothetical protein